MDEQLPDTIKPDADHASEHPAPPGPAFEDLTLGQALGYLLLRPVETGRRLWRVLAGDDRGEDDDEDDQPPGEGPAWRGPEREAAGEDAVPGAAWWRRVDAVVWRRLGHVAILGLAVLLALRGGHVLHDAALNPALHARGDTNGAGVWFVLAALMYGAYVYRRARRGRAEDDEQLIVEDAEAPGRTQLTGENGVAAGVPAQPAGRAWWSVNVLQLALIPLAAALSLVAYTANVLQGPSGAAFDVVLTPGGAVAWGLSVLVWGVVLGVDVARVPDRVRAALRSDPDWGERIAQAVRRIDAPLVALALVTLAGLWFRTLDLAAVPPEMTSDHIEKLLDALKVHNGYYAVFFPNNGGREAFQMYVVAFVAGELGVGFNFNALKWATVIEGVITLPVVFWMAVQVIGTRTERDRRIGCWVGVALAGLLAVSSWHLMLSRLGLRIVLTPLATALVIGFLARALHHNRTRDYLALGAVLGAGVYFYQANRMLPLLVVVGVALAILGTLRCWRDVPKLALQMAGIAVLAMGPVALLALAGERARDLLPIAASAWFAVVALWLRAERHPAAWRHAGGLLVAAVVALALYVPMYHYSRLYPDQFWNRTRGRLFGEDAFTRVTESGVRVAHEPSLREQAERFWEQRDVFITNYRDALRMWHWEGDAAWINNAHSYPALDGITGGLLILGGVAWAAWALRRRDPAVWLLPVSVLIMLLPSALTLAYTIENPSFTRTSGTIPALFMLAGLPLGVLCWRASRIPGRVWGFSVGPLLALAILGVVVGGALDWNRDNFYTHYRLNYSSSWKPYREIAKPLRTFAQGEGSYGNAFMVAYPHWLDHRILGAMAGDIRWPNGLVTRGELFDAVARNAGTAYAYDPARPLFVMVHADDQETLDYLREQFPGGDARLYSYTWQTGPGIYSSGEFYIFSAPPGAIADD